MDLSSVEAELKGIFYLVYFVVSFTTNSYNIRAINVAEIGLVEPFVDVKI